MKISQVGHPTVFLSSRQMPTESSNVRHSVAVNVSVKVQERSDDDGPLLAQLQLGRGTRLEGKAIEGGRSGDWLLFRIPRDLCPEGGCLTLCALVDELTLWSREYRVVWRNRFPSLEPLD